jgi:anti-sigma regulatory factor (Ser/Thr protein kinase)
MELTIPAAPAQLAGLRQAARHALREVPPQIADEPVQVAVLGPGDWAEATVVDHGPAQPPHPPPTTDRLSSRGRGLWLLACLVDEVRVERVKPGTRATLRRRIRSPSRPRGGGRQPSAGRAFS